MATDGLSYNGIVIYPLKTHSWEKRKINDSRETFLWIEHTIRVSGLINPATMPYVLEGGKVNVTFTPTPPPIAVEAVSVHGTIAPLSEIAIRTALQQPQKKLLFVIGHQVVLESPEPGKSVDVQNGPKCKVMSIRCIHGTRTFSVDCELTTYTRDDSNCVNVPSCLLSNNWEMESLFNPDDGYRETRITRGRAFFRTDRLDELDAAPDDFRQAVVPPVPPSFRRDRAEVLAAEDGGELRWTVYDVEQYQSLKALGITKIEATVDSGVTTRSLAEIAADGIQTGFSAGLDIIGAILGFRRGRPGQSAQGLTGTAAGILQSLRQNAENAAPKSFRKVRVRVIGVNGTSHQFLVMTGWRVLMSQAPTGGGAFGGVVSFGIDTAEHRDLFAADVTVEATWIGGPIQAVLNPVSNPAQIGINGAVLGLASVLLPLPNAANGGVAPTPAMPSDIAIPANFDVGAGNGLALPKGGGTRGVYLARIAAQALQEPFQAPPPPALQPQAQNLTPP